MHEHKSCNKNISALIHTHYLKLAAATQGSNVVLRYLMEF